jgi:hypothetical protein
MVRDCSKEGLIGLSLDRKLEYWIMDLSSAGARPWLLLSGCMKTRKMRVFNVHTVSDQVDGVLVGRNCDSPHAAQGLRPGSGCLGIDAQSRWCSLDFAGSSGGALTGQEYWLV